MKIGTALLMALTATALAASGRLVSRPGQPEGG